MTSKGALTVALFCGLAGSVGIAAAQSGRDGQNGTAAQARATAAVPAAATPLPGELRAAPAAPSPRVQDGRRLFLLFTLLKPRG